MDLTKTDGSTPIWDVRTFADVSTSFVKVEVDTVYAAGKIGFKEVEFYHNDCIRGWFVCLFFCLQINLIGFSFLKCELLARIQTCLVVQNFGTLYIP